MLKRFSCSKVPSVSINPSATAHDLLHRAQARIDAMDAVHLLLHALQRDRSWLYAHGDEGVEGAVATRFEALVQRRSAGEPVAYLIGSRGFWTLDLVVTPDTLIPRPDTELLVELVLARIAINQAAHIADLGTGSGAIALSIAKERPQARVIATDASDAALAVARGNAQRSRIDHVSFVQGDWCSALGDARFDVIASNPPYVAEGDPHLQQGDLRFEPMSALACGDDGLSAIRVIVRDAPKHLVSGGWLLLEHGWEQGSAVRALLANAGFVDIATHRDLEQRERVTLGRIAQAG